MIDQNLDDFVGENPFWAPDFKVPSGPCMCVGSTQVDVGLAVS